MREREEKAQILNRTRARLDELVEMSRTQKHPDISLMRVLSATEDKLRTVLGMLEKQLETFDAQSVEPARGALTEAAVHVRSVEALLTRRKLEHRKNEEKQEAALLDELSQRGWYSRLKH